MTKRQFLPLFLIMLLNLTVGMGLIPLLPIYASQLGASTVAIGYYMASAWLLLALGSVVGGWLCNRGGGCRKWMLVASPMALLSCLAMSLAPSMSALTVATSMLWFCGGLIISLDRIMVSQLTPQASQGRIQGLLSLGVPLGSLLGGAATGFAAELLGFRPMLRLLALCYVLVALLLLLGRKEGAAPSRIDAIEERSPTGLRAHGLSWLLMAVLIEAVGGQVSGLTVPLSMTTLGFGPAAIASTGIVSGLASLPLHPLFGSLSDRLGRKGISVLAIMIAVAGRASLAGATVLWQFWAAVALMIFGLSFFTVSVVWAGDLAPHGQVGRAIALVTASNSFGGVLGYAVAGHTIERLGAGWATGLAAMTGLIVVALILAVPAGAPATAGKAAAPA